MSKINRQPLQVVVAKQGIHTWKNLDLSSKWMEDLNVRPESLALLKEKVQKTFQDNSIVNSLNRTVTQEITPAINQTFYTKFPCRKTKR